MVGFVSLAVRQQEITEERARREREWQEEQTRREEERERQELQERRLYQLADDAAVWREATRLREFADAVEEEIRERSPEAPLAPDLTGWLAWVRDAADERDPLRLLDLSGHLLREPAQLWQYHTRTRSA
jgi:hypothetical protein